MSAINIDKNNFHREVMNSDKPVLLDVTRESMAAKARRKEAAAKA